MALFCTLSSFYCAVSIGFKFPLIYPFTPLLLCLSFSIGPIIHLQFSTTFVWLGFTTNKVSSKETTGYATWPSATCMYSPYATCEWFHKLWFSCRWFQGWPYYAPCKSFHFYSVSTGYTFPLSYHFTPLVLCLRNLIGSIVHPQFYIALVWLGVTTKNASNKKLPQQKAQGLFTIFCDLHVLLVKSSFVPCSSLLQCPAIASAPYKFILSAIACINTSYLQVMLWIVFSFLPILLCPTIIESMCLVLF